MFDVSNLEIGLKDQQINWWYMNLLGNVDEDDFYVAVLQAKCICGWESVLYQPAAAAKDNRSTHFQCCHSSAAGILDFCVLSLCLVVSFSSSLHFASCFYCFRTCRCILFLSLKIFLCFVLFYTVLIPLFLFNVVLRYFNCFIYFYVSFHFLSLLHFLYMSCAIFCW